MDVMKKLLRVLQDDYKVGVEAKSKVPVIYLDPNKIDLWVVDNAKKKGDLAAVGRQIGDQLDEQFPGLSSKLTNAELIQMLKASREYGPFADKNLLDHGVCIINQPLGNQVDKEKIHETFGFKIFSDAHLKPLPGTSAMWRETIGEHEGEHCNQQPVMNGDPKVDLKAMDGEIKSDLTALRSLLQKGHHDVAQTLIDIRSVGAANGDSVHATSIFLTAQTYEGVTEAHLNAAQNLNQEMALAVAQERGISLTQAEKLRREDPQKFAEIIENALNEGKIPAHRDADYDDIKIILAKEMGLSPDEFEALGREKIPEIKTAYDKAKAEGKITVPGEDDPHVKEYMRHYVGAVQRLFVPDTTPKNHNETKAAFIPEREQTPEELAAALSAADKEKDAREQYRNIINIAVAIKLNITPQKAYELQSSDPDKHFEVAEELLNNKLISFDTLHENPDGETERLIANSMKIATADLDAPYTKDSFEYSLAEEKVYSFFQYKNPYVEEYIQNEIDIYRQEKEERLKLHEDYQQKISKNDTAIQNPPYQVAHNNASGGGVPEIDLRNGDRAQMTINTLPVRDYFSLQAAPPPAQDKIALAQAPVISKTDDFHNSLRPMMGPAPA